MKRFESDSYDTIAIKGYYGLAVNGETLESVRADITGQMQEQSRRVIRQSSG